MLSVGYVLGPHGTTGFLNPRSKINILLLIVYPFLLFISPFLLLHLELEVERSEEKQRVRKQSKRKRESKMKEDHTKRGSQGSMQF